MTVYEGCERGHDLPHKTRSVRVELGGPTGYHDHPPIPDRLARTFDIEVWDTDIYPVDDGPYCPAHDAVSQTIVAQGVWEPVGTIMALHVCSGDAPGIMVDFGAQIGWYSTLALMCGRTVQAIESDAENCRLLNDHNVGRFKVAQIPDEFSDRHASVAINYMTVDESRVEILRALFEPIEDEGIVPGSQRIRFAKIDIEGAERWAVAGLWPMIESGQVDHLLVEVTPIFADYYPDLVADLVDAGYEAYLLPAKRTPPWPLDDPAVDLAPLRFGLGPRSGLREFVASWRQEDVWFKREDASW